MELLSIVFQSINQSIFIECVRTDTNTVYASQNQ